MTDAQTPIESDALKANLLETAVDGVTIDPSCLMLLETVKDFQGVHKNIEELLLEISHPFRNWRLILPKIRSFSLKNIDRYHKSPAAPEAFIRFCDIFFQALAETTRNEALQSFAMESLLAYIEKQISLFAFSDLERYGAAINSCFQKLHGLEDQTLLYLVQSHHPLKKIVHRIVAIYQEGKTSFDIRPVGRLLQRILTLNYQYWLSENDPQEWFLKQCEEICEGWRAGSLFLAISHNKLKEYQNILSGIEIDARPDDLAKILSLPTHMDIVRLYKQVPEQLFEEPPGRALGLDRFAENRKLLFLFRIMETAGLSLIHEESLREINRGLVHLVRQQTFEEIERFLLTTFQLLKANVRKYPHTSLQCIQVLGSEVFKRGNSRLVEAFLWETVRFGFQYSNVSGVDEDWQPIANPAHLANIRVWLSLVMQEPKWCSTLFSALIINLKLSGTCVKDTDLFQRDITQLLNHPIEPVYNLVKQFAKLMPVFFNEIGAEGLLRDVSTELDEMHSRKDMLIHFLRKQSHVESSNLIVGFIEAIFGFWQTKNKALLGSYLPEEVLRQVKSSGPYIDDLSLLMNRVFALSDLSVIEDLLGWDDNRRNTFLAEQKDLAESETRRFSLLVDMYKLLHQKYNLGVQEIRHQLKLAVNSGFPEMEQLLADLEICDTFQGLSALLAHLERLKEIILSGETFAAKESIYHKRHIAVDIPSVYGRYEEKKFDALSLTFRLENLANIYLEKLLDSINLSFITRATFIRIIKCLRIYLKALKIDGISSRRLDTYMSLLDNSLGIKRFSYTQYLDIIRGLSEGVKDVIYTYYTNIHQNNLSIIIPQIGKQNLLAKYQPLWDGENSPENINRISETFMRDLISGTFGLQYLDNFITRIYQTLEHQKELLDEEHLDLLMTYNPDRAICFLHQKTQQSSNLILLGNKGYNLAFLASDGMPVPRGFVITTEIFRCWPVIKEFALARHELMGQIRAALAELEGRTKRRFGDPENPLLLSVRSGAAISMPGMMATIHNVGLNEDIVEGFARSSDKEFLAWDNYRRFLQSWAMTEGMEREVFQGLMNEAKSRHNVEVKRQFTSSQMKELALDYQKKIRAVGIGIPDDPWLQLTGAIELVLQSWFALKTKEYRSLMDISDAWGTAVIVQAMVYGNLSTESGSGVLFTAHPYRKVSRVALWGDYAPSDQGEDIVSGLVTTYPISIEQAEIDGRSKDFTLEVRFPKTYNTLLAISRELVYEKRWNPQEIEFTFEGPEEENLYILQTRDMITIKKKENFDVFEETKILEKSVLGFGIGVSGSALSGRAVFNEENIRLLKEKDPSSPVILIRQDTVPEDIKDIAVADGLLTARGGQTSHASVVATRLEKTCVVGCNKLKVFENEEFCEINGMVIRFGDEVSIDGRKGLFLVGRHPIRKEVHILPI